MEIRPYLQADRPRIEQLHAQQGFAFEFPNLEDPLFHVRLVCERDGKIVAAAFAQLTAEVFGFFDSEAGTPHERYQNLLGLHEVGCRAAWYPGGLSTIHAWLPPQIEKSFGRRLMRLGWRKSLWPCFFRTLVSAQVDGSGGTAR